ncbi:leucyl aminopeptidase [Leifsonia aquatica]|uniref:leucyl aminopeptidase n=1 Tax=Leifsonia aquatica TaxID=144185 RepID=UPI0004683099|nr:leucyl aminopeptidase [Leifsonia aquatica]
MASSAYKLIPGDFTPIPSLAPERVVNLRPVTAFSGEVGAVGVAVTSDADVPDGVGLDREALARVGFDGKLGQTLVVPGPAPTTILVGAGAAADVTAATVRDLAATFARAATSSARIGMRLPDTDRVDAETIGRVAAEGILLGRYRYSELKTEPKTVTLEAVELLVDAADVAGATAGIAHGVVAARAAAVARDLANTPPGHLTATDFGNVAVSLAESFGLEVEIADKAKLIELGCGGLLGVNAGSAEEPRMITIRYTPNDPSTGHLALVGKGIMYDSGGISLKPSDPMHLLMKMDMGGAAAVFGAMTALRDLGCTTTVSAFLMCTDNMPSGSAYKLGDVLTARGGTTVEVKNTDAEGRLVMMDGLVLAAEQKPDAIIDIATLTGAALMALGPATAALFGNDQALVDQVRSASSPTDEQLWQLPLEKKYRKTLDSDIADIANLGGPYAGATTAALFLSEFVDGLPWAHLDIAGTMQSEADDGWRSKGATGYGARLLIETAMTFSPTR